MSKKKETVFKEKFLPKLKALPGSWVEKIQQRAIRGTPDILMCYYGWFLAFELKGTEDDVADELQKHNLQKIERAGGYSFIVTPENAEETLRFVRSLKPRRVS